MKNFLILGTMVCALAACAARQHPTPRMQQDRLNEAALKKSLKERKGLYEVKKLVVLPVANRNLDLSAGVLIRHFLEKELKSNGYQIFSKRDKTDLTLRQMGLDSMQTLSPQDMRRVGQTAQAQGVVQATLVRYSHDPFQEKIYIKAKFVMIEVYAGRVLWEKEVVFEKKGIIKEPISNVFSANADRKEISDSEIQALAKSKAGDVPETVVDMAAKSMPSSKEASRLSEQFPGGY